MTAPEQPVPRRFPRRVYGVGTEPDARFSLANERTFLAWIRTALALIAAGVALEAFVLPIAPGCGGTPHFEYVSDAATSGLTQVSILTGKPVGFGVLTLDDEQQGLDRAGLEGSKEDKGEEAANAAIATAVLLRQLRGA